MPVPFTSTTTISITFGEPVEVDVLSTRLRDPLYGLLPPGRAFAPRVGSTLWGMVVGVAQIFGRVEVLRRRVFAQLDPRTATFGLENWESLLALSGGSLDEAARRLRILSKLRTPGGQNGPSFKQLLEELGYENVVIEPLGDAFRCGDRCAAHGQGPDWQFAFMIRATSIPELDDEMMSAVRAKHRASWVVHFILV